MTYVPEFEHEAHSRDSTDDLDPHFALEQSQFVPYFQPLIHLHTGQLTGFEVLARWQHPRCGLIPPNDFIPSAERDGWIGAMMRQLLQKAFTSISLVSDTLTLAINVSPLQLRNPSLPREVASMASEADFSLSRLIVEITESAIINDIAAASVIAAELKAMGCKLALDDFGTGYSSLNHLQALPFDEIKVDQSFVRSMMEKRESRKIVSAVVGLGQSLNLVTVAEGIETRRQAEMMLWLGCEFGQGYFFGRPMPAESLMSFVVTQRENNIANDLRVSQQRVFNANWESSPSHRLAQLEAVYDGAPVALAFLDQEMRYRNVNKRLADMNHTTVEAHIGSHLSEMIPDLFPYVEPYVRRALNGEVLKDIEVHSPESKRTRCYNFHPAYDEAGEVIGVSFSALDVTERKLAEAALTMREAHYKSMVELDPKMLWVMDAQGRSLDVIPRWDKVTGELQQHPTNYDWLASVHPDDLQATVRAVSECRQNGTPIDVEYRACDSDGGWCWKRSRGSPRFDCCGEIVCWYGSVQDIARPRQRLQKASEPKAAIDDPPGTKDIVAPVGSQGAARRDHVLGELQILDTPAEPEFDDLVTFASEICGTPISLISLVSSDRQWFKASIGVAVSQTPISLSFCAHTIEQNRPLIVEDTTKDDRFDHHPMVTGDPGVRFYAGIPIYAGEDVAIGTLCVVDIVPRTLSASQVKALSILSQQVQTRLQLRGERIKLLEASADKQMLAQQLEDTKETLVQATAQLEQLVSTDTLTGLLNRHGFEENLMEAFESADLQTQSLSLLLLDVVDFKQRNLRLGHAAGDQTLESLGEVLQSTVRDSQVAARIGDKEFAILLPETSGFRADVMAKRIQAILQLGGVDIVAVTVSTGLPGSESCVSSGQELLAEASRQLFLAKQAAKGATLEGLHVA